MGKETKIEWCDSTLNLQMGCDGCELWNPAAGVKHCYAGSLTERYANPEGKGFPIAFDQPKLFLERLEPALNWPDLTGKPRPEKPWLDDMPRLIFLDDMGDTFTESLPLDWLAPLLPRLAASPHQWLLLTKRPKRMATFSQSHPLPSNVWPGTSVTSQSNANRIDDLLRVQGGGPRWVSAEPLLGKLDLLGRLDLVDWIIVGGESGANARPMEVPWLHDLQQQALADGVPLFFKQWGEYRPVNGVEWVSNGGKRSDLYVREWGEMVRVGTAAAGSLLNGQHVHQMPEVYTPCHAP